MKELLSSTSFWVAISAVVLLIIYPIVSIIRWLCAREKLRRAKGIPKTKGSVVKNVFRGIVMYLMTLTSDGVGFSSWETMFDEEAKEFKRQAEIETLKKRPCEAKLPDAPRWHCGCGRVNPAHTATCVCGRNMRDIPMGHRYPAEKPSTWHCACGREVPVYTSTCVCGRNKPTAIQEN